MPTSAGQGGLWKKAMLDKIAKFIIHLICRGTIHIMGIHSYWNTWKLLSQENKHLPKNVYEFTCVSRKTRQCFAAWLEQQRSTTVRFTSSMWIEMLCTTFRVFYALLGSFFFLMYILNFLCSAHSVFSCTVYQLAIKNHTLFIFLFIPKHLSSFKTCIFWKEHFVVWNLVCYNSCRSTFRTCKNNLLETHGK